MFGFNLNKNEWLQVFILLIVSSSFLACTPSSNLSSDEKLLENEDASQFIITDEGYDVTPQPTPALSEDPETKKVNDYWRIERFRDYTFRVCLNDRNVSLRLRKQKFSIINGFQGLQKEPTDHDGCLRWTETIEYNYFADAKYVVLERKIKGIGAYRGVFNLEIAVNPWASRDKTGSEVIFLKPRRGVVSESLLVRGSHNIKRALLGKGVDKKTLFLENFQVQLKKNGASEPNRFSLWLSKGVIKVRVLNIKGVDKPIPIETGGHFRVFTRILQYSSISGNIDSLDEMTIMSDSPSVVLNAKGRIEELPHRQTSLKNSLDIQMTKYLSRNWDEEVGRLVLRVQPLDFPYGDFFKQFEGIYDLDLLTSLHNSSFKATVNSFETKKYALKNNDMISLFDKIFTSAYITNGKFIEKNKVASLSDGVERRKGFQKYDFSDMKPSFEEVIRGESLTTRGVGFRVKTCLTSKFNGARPPLGEPFQVVVKSRITHEKTVYNLKIKGQDRCLNFVHKFWFKHFKPEILFFFDFSVREVASNQMVEEFLGVSVNPWDEGWTFGRDIIHLSEDYIREVTEMQKIPPRFFLPYFNYYTLRFRYAIDQFLNLKVKKSILLHLRPMMVRYNSRRQGRFGVYKLRDGIYLMKAAIEKKYLDPTQGVTTAIYTGEGGDNDRLAAQEVLSEDLSEIHYLSVVKRLVRVIDGQIIAPVEFVVQDLRIMRIRSQLMVQLEPVEEWRHYMVKLYNDFYERLEGELQKKSIISFDTFDLLNKEKIRNIKKIIDSMTHHERQVHDLIDREFKEEEREEKTYKVASQSGQVIEYRGCYGMPEITWDKIFDEFDLDHTELSQFFSTSLSDKDRSLVFNPKKVHLLRKNVKKQRMMRKESDDWNEVDGLSQKSIMVCLLFRVYLTMGVEKRNTVTHPTM